MEDSRASGDIWQSTFVDERSSAECADDDLQSSSVKKTRRSRHRSTKKYYQGLCESQLEDLCFNLAQLINRQHSPLVQPLVPSRSGHCQIPQRFNLGKSTGRYSSGPTKVTSRRMLFPVGGTILGGGAISRGGAMSRNELDDYHNEDMITTALDHTEPLFDDVDHPCLTSNQMKNIVFSKTVEHTWKTSRESTAFHLFSYKIQPFLRLPNTMMKDVLMESWHQLSQMERYRFEMHWFTMTDEQKKIITEFVETTSTRRKFKLSQLALENDKMNNCSRKISGRVGSPFASKRSSNKNQDTFQEPRSSARRTRQKRTLEDSFETSLALLGITSHKREKLALSDKGNIGKGTTANQKYVTPDYAEGIKEDSFVVNAMDNIVESSKLGSTGNSTSTNQELTGLFDSHPLSEEFHHNQSGDSSSLTLEHAMSFQNCSSLSCSSQDGFSSDYSSDTSTVLSVIVRPPRNTS